VVPCRLRADSRLTLHVRPFRRLQSHLQPAGANSADRVFVSLSNRVDGFYAFAASVFTHLLEPHARHYLRETGRVLVAGGRALLSIHDEPPAGQRFAGTEDRIDIEDAYFIELAAESGLRLTEHLGDVCGQQMFLFTRS